MPQANKPAEGFFEHIQRRFIENYAERSERAARWYNYCAVTEEDSRFKLDKHNVHILNPYERARWEGFDSWADAANDFKSLILKPCIFLALSFYELINLGLSLVGAVVQLITLNPQGFLDKLIDTVEAYAFRVLFKAMAFVELALQVSSFFMRIGFNIHEACQSNKADTPDTLGNVDGIEADMDNASARP